MNKLKKLFSSMAEKAKRNKELSAHRALLEELFNDYYAKRHEVYKMNFFRGVFFGLGSVLGGTVVVALVLWVLSLFVDFPLIGQLLRDTQQTLEQKQ